MTRKFNPPSGYVTASSIAQSVRLVLRMETGKEVEIYNREVYAAARTLRYGKQKRAFPSGDRVGFNPQEAEAIRDYLIRSAKVDPVLQLDTPAAPAESLDPKALTDEQIIAEATRRNLYLGNCLAEATPIQLKQALEARGYTVDATRMERL